jgi:hypothetical protein
MRQMLVWFLPAKVNPSMLSSPEMIDCVMTVHFTQVRALAATGLTAEYPAAFVRLSFGNRTCP